MRRADSHNRLHLLGALRIDDSVRWLVWNPGERVAVLLAHSLRGGEAIAEGCSERRHGLLGGARVAALTHCLCSARCRTTLLTSALTLGTSSSRKGTGRHRSITITPSRAIR